MTYSWIYAPNFWTFAFPVVSLSCQAHRFTISDNFQKCGGRLQKSFWHCLHGLHASFIFLSGNFFLQQSWSWHLLPKTFIVDSWMVACILHWKIANNANPSSPMSNRDLWTEEGRRDAKAAVLHQRRRQGELRRTRGSYGELGKQRFFFWLSLRSTKTLTEGVLLSVARKDF